MKNLILVIDAHPDGKSFSAAIAKSYADGVFSAKGDVELLHLRDLQFDLSLRAGYREVMPLEPDLKEAQRLIGDAKHIAFFYPQWWGSAPAVLKGFIDRVFLPRFAFHYHEKGPGWDKLLKGRSAEIWLMSDSPWFWYFFKYRNSPVQWLKTATLEFSGIQPVKVHAVDRVRFLTEEERSVRIALAHSAGISAAQRLNE